MKKYIRYLVGVAILCFIGTFMRMTLLYFEGKNANAIYPVRVECRNFQDAISLYKSIYGSYPVESNGLTTMIKDETCQKLLKHTNLEDPWGTPYRYRVINDRPLVDSAGRDRKFNTPDDIHAF